MAINNSSSLEFVLGLSSNRFNDVAVLPSSTVVEKGLHVDLYYSSGNLKIVSECSLCWR